MARYTNNCREYSKEMYERYVEIIKLRRRNVEWACSE